MDREEFIPVLFYIAEQKNVDPALQRIQKRYGRGPSMAFLGNIDSLEFPENITKKHMPLPKGHVIFAEEQKELQHEYERTLKTVP